MSRMAYILSRCDATKARIAAIRGWGRERSQPKLLDHGDVERAVKEAEEASEER